MRPAPAPAPAPARAPAAYDLDTSRIEDEPLVVLAQECGYSLAHDELLRRCNAQAVRLIGRLAARTGLQNADCKDAQQEAVLWTLEAIQHYRTEEQVKPQGCHFRSFLHRVLTARFIDFLRHQRCRESHFPLLGEVNSAGTGSVRLTIADAFADPLALMERGELRARLERELDRLSPLARRLWDLLAQGVPLRRAAAALGLSYDAAKRRRRKLLARLKSSLTGSQPGQPLQVR
jgi:RNA polymerase sigma factor (sigma-70 family)